MPRSRKEQYPLHRRPDPNHQRLTSRSYQPLSPQLFCLSLEQQRQGDTLLSRIPYVRNASAPYIPERPPLLQDRFFFRPQPYANQTYHLTKRFNGTKFTKEKIFPIFGKIFSQF